jgi:hypothetical protein
MPIPPKIIKYIPIQGELHKHEINDFFDLYLKKYIDNGYELQGGIHVGPGRLLSTIICTQAIIKRDYSVCK